MEPAQIQSLAPCSSDEPFAIGVHLLGPRGGVRKTASDIDLQFGDATLVASERLRLFVPDRIALHGSVTVVMGAAVGATA